MTSNTDGVRGPMYIEATPLMVTADVEPLVHANTGEVLDLLMGEFFDDFMEIAQSTPGDRDVEKLLYEDLRARLVEHMSTKVALTGPQAMRVAGRMSQLARPLAALSAKTAAVVMQVQRRKERAA